jgi:hypothetical protein
LSAAYPIGSIYINAGVSTNPATLLGFGTWTAFGDGRVLVGLDSTDALFDTLEETGGSKTATLVSHTHTATVTDSGHLHTYTKPQGTDTVSGGGITIQTNSGAATANTSTAVTGISVANSTEGSSGTNANVQPFIVVKMWKRTA